MRCHVRHAICGITIALAGGLLWLAAPRLPLPVATAEVGGAYPQLILSVPGTTRDLGHTTDRKRWHVAFPARNAGRRRLVISEIDLECGCGDRTRRTFIIPPGASADLIVPLDTRFAAGPTEAIAAFTSNDPSRPRFHLTVRATVDAAGLPEPSLATAKPRPEGVNHKP